MYIDQQLSNTKVLQHFVIKLQLLTKIHCRNFILSTLCYLIIVAATHLVIGDRDETINPHVIGDALPRAILLHNLVQDYNDKAAIRYISPALQYSTDDSTMFVFKGTA